MHLSQTLFSFLKARLKPRLSSLVSLVLMLSLVILGQSKLEAKKKSAEIRAAEPKVSLQESRKTQILSATKSLSKVEARKLEKLTDSAYELAANYVPVLMLRCIAESQVVRKAKTAHVERFFYQNLKKPKLVETLIFDIKIEKTGLFDRKAIVIGKLDDLDLYYENDMDFGISRKGSSEVSASLNKSPFIKLHIESDGSKLSNRVKGEILSKKIDYFTKHRDTKGLLGGYPYEMYAEGVHTGALYTGFSKGKIGEYEISGSAKETSKDQYEIEEYYGPLLIKTKLRIN